MATPVVVTAVHEERLNFNRATKNTVRFDADEDSFSDVSTLYINKAAFKEFHEANGTFPAFITVTVEHFESN